MPRKTGISKFPVIVVPSVRQLPRFADQGQPAFVTSNRRIYYFQNNQWNPYYAGDPTPETPHTPHPNFLWTNNNVEPASWVYSPDPNPYDGIWGEYDTGLEWNVSNTRKLYLHDISYLATSWLWQVYKDNVLLLEFTTQHVTHPWQGVVGEVGTYKIRLTINGNPALVAGSLNWTQVEPP